jgi:hypothetical protein
MSNLLYFFNYTLGLALVSMELYPPFVRFDLLLRLAIYSLLLMMDLKGEHCEASF